MDDSRTSPDPRLSVVFPAYNEAKWIARSVEAVVAAAENARWDVEIVVVDDGSTDGTGELLDQLAARYGVVVVHQENRGRFETVRTAVQTASHPRVLILGSRVVIDDHSLLYLKRQLVDHPERVVWNGHVRIETEGSPYAGFWRGLLQIVWRRYLRRPHLTSFGIADFDAYPKGSGFFSVPKDMFEKASEAFDSMFDDVRFASDDTRLIRWIAERERIYISPEFSGSYFHGRETLRTFARHTFFRGTTFIDGYLGHAGAGRRAAIAVLLAGAAGLTLLVLYPVATLAAGLVGLLAVALAVKACGGPARDAWAVLRILPLFAVCFGAGAVRGLVLAAKARLTRGFQRRSRPEHQTTS